MHELHDQILRMFHDAALIKDEDKNKSSWGYEDTRKYRMSSMTALTREVARNCINYALDNPLFKDTVSMFHAVGKDNHYGEWRGPCHYSMGYLIKQKIYHLYDSIRPRNFILDDPEILKYYIEFIETLCSKEISPWRDVLQNSVLYYSDKGIPYCIGFHGENDKERPSKLDSARLVNFQTALRTCWECLKIEEYIWARKAGLSPLAALYMHFTTLKQHDKETVAVERRIGHYPFNSGSFLSYNRFKNPEFFKAFRPKPLSFEDGHTYRPCNEHWYANMMPEHKHKSIEAIVTSCKAQVMKIKSNLFKVNEEVLKKNAYDNVHDVAKMQDVAEVFKKEVGE